MKVQTYVVIYRQYALDEVDSTEVCGVFSTRDAAETYIETVNVDAHFYVQKWFEILEIEIDKEQK